MSKRRLKVDPRRERLGFLGLGLLRGWPTEDPKAAAARMEAMHQTLDAGETENDVRTIEVVEAEEGYRLWAPTYGPNPLIAAEEPSLRRSLEAIPPARA